MHTKWGLYWRGLAMGAVETIPGVSSGTLALITGIYAELIRTLGNLHPRLITTWRQQGLRAVWQQANLTFLLLLLAGMVTSIIPSVFIIRWFLANAAIPLWAFFCGLILMGTVVVWRPLPDKRLHVWWAALLGSILSMWLSGLPGLYTLGLSPLLFFVAGALAICAMLLPGISGSFILLLLGMYEPVLDALSNMQVLDVSAFILGCAVGALAFVQLLKWLLAHYYSFVMAAAAGVMLGSLVKLWPWKITSDNAADVLMYPAEYAAHTGEPAQLGMAMLAFAVGLVAVFFLGEGHRSKTK